MDNNNLEEYQDPVNYDLEFGGEQQKYAFFIDLAQRYKGQVLELACGTGLTALPIAKLDIPVTGVDLSAGMLEHARAKAKNLAVEFIEADARNFLSPKRFSLIYLTGNAFQAFLTRPDQEALLATVRNHLEPNGVLAFETRNPSGTDLSLEKTEVAWHSYNNVEGDLVQVSGTQQYEATTQIMQWKTIRRWREKASVTRIFCRFIYPAELAALLHDNGFYIKEQYGDWDKSPLEEQSPSIITVCGLT